MSRLHGFVIICPVKAEAMPANGDLPILKPKRLKHGGRQKVAFTATTAMFVGKSCSDDEAALWAYDHQRINGVTPTMAPSIRAWNFFRDMKDDPKFRNKIAEKVVDMAFKRREDSEANKRFDGEGVYNTLAKVEEMAKAGGVVE